jgi:hypothetical protein
MRLGLVVALIGAIGLHAAQRDVDARAVLDAIAIGQSAFDADRLRFHAPYRVDVRQPPLDSVDVVTPFRRVVVAAELRAQAGDRRFGQRDGLAIVNRYPGQISVHADFTFHPLNTLVMVPTFSVRWVTGKQMRVEALLVDSAPRYFPKVGSAALPTPPGGQVLPPSLPGRSQPMLGATVVAFFDGAVLLKPEDPAREVVIEEAGKQVARLPIDLSRLR